MNREEAREYMRTHARDYLTPDRSGKGFICPICLNGSGKNGRGILTKDKIHFTCFSTKTGEPCFTHADIIDIIGLEAGLTDYNAKFLEACKRFGITLDSNNGEYRPPERREKPMTKQPAVVKINYEEYFLKASQNIEATTYHRGITLETLKRFRIGYDPKWIHPKVNPYLNIPPSPRLIIPTSKESYLARDTREKLTEEQKHFSKQKVGATSLFNAKALYEATQPIFIVEGEIDALSIIDVGGEAIALGSVSNKEKLLAMLEQKSPLQPLIIMLDNDEAGNNASKSLGAYCYNAGITYVVKNLPGNYKDANQFLMEDREAFTVFIAETKDLEAEHLALIKETLKQEAVAYSLQDFLDSIEESKNYKCISTGLPNVDNVLDGGLYPGLYIIGAISSLGKTSLCLQIADSIAQAGNDVLIFSLEMARNELIAKSVSRLTLTLDMDLYNSTKNAKTTRGILAGTRYDQYSQREKTLILQAIEAYKEYGQNIYITEGVGNVGVAQIKERVERHIKITGKAPVILVDYLQILAPYDIKATDKQNTDKAVLELKRLSRDYNIPVFCISSFNRDNYNAPVNLASFKESGAIEYSSDVLLGLQYAGMDYQKGEKESQRLIRLKELIETNIELGKQGKGIALQLKVLKNRNGSKGSTYLDFYPMFNYFTESMYGGEDETGWTNI